MCDLFKPIQFCLNLIASFIGTGFYFLALLGSWFGVMVLGCFIFVMISIVGILADTPRAGLNIFNSLNYDQNPPFESETFYRVKTMLGVIRLAIDVIMAERRILTPPEQRLNTPLMQSGGALDRV